MAIPRTSLPLLLLFTLAALPVTVSSAASASAAGRVVAVWGNSHALAPDGTRRTLRRGSELFPGETLVTGDNGTLQIRLQDQGVLTLQARTEVRVHEFSTADSGRRGAGRLELVRGGFRTISGGNAVQWETELGVIEARNGNTYECFLDVQLWCGVYSGGISLRNGAGLLSLGIGSEFDYAQIPTAGTAPLGLLEQPEELGGANVNPSPDDVDHSSLQRPAAPASPPLSQNPAFPDPDPIVVTPRKQ